MNKIPFRFKVYIGIFLCVVCFGTIGIMVSESLHPFDAFYFVMVTVATVGFGDISPHTVTGKIITLGIILTGVGCFVAIAADVIEYFISERERIERLRKMNMLIGVFFSECGTDLLRSFSAIDSGIATIRTALVVSNTWSLEDFTRARNTPWPAIPSGWTAGCLICPVSMHSCRDIKRS